MEALLSAHEILLLCKALDVRHNFPSLLRQIGVAHLHCIPDIFSDFEVLDDIVLDEVFAHDLFEKRLQAAVSGADKAAVGEALTQLEEIMSKDLVKYDIVKNLKVGKDVGNAMKMGDPDLAQQGRKVVAHIQRLAQKQDLMGA
jgi:hypothetical protein